VAAVEVPRIIDIDRPSDLQHANAWSARANVDIGLEEQRPLGPISRDLSQPLVLTAAARRERHGYPGCDGGATRARGWRAIRTTERESRKVAFHGALYLNMCQGSLAAEQLMPLESDGRSW